MAKNSALLFSKIIQIDTYMTQLSINSILYDVKHFIFGYVLITLSTDKK